MFVAFSIEFFFLHICVMFPRCGNGYCVVKNKIFNFRSAVTYPTNTDLVLSGSRRTHFRFFVRERLWCHFTRCRLPSVFCPIEPSTTVTSEGYSPRTMINSSAPLKSEYPFNLPKPGNDAFKSFSSNRRKKQHFFVRPRTENVIFIMEYFI